MVIFFSICLIRQELWKKTQTVAAQQRAVELAEVEAQEAKEQGLFSTDTNILSVTDVECSS